MRPIPNSKFNIQYSQKRGALLLELLIAVSILAIILSISSQSVYTSLQSGKISSESDVATGLANETLEATRAISDEKWQNIYNLTKGAQYHVVQSGTKWATSATSEAIALNAANYVRFFTIQNICRDTIVGSRLITGLTDGPIPAVADGTLTACTTSTGLFDPSTQKITVTVSWQGSGSPIVISDYFLRWKNKVCNQAGWTTQVGGGSAVCTGDTTYDTKDTWLNTTGGLQIVQPL